MLPGIGPMELIVVLVIALVIFGPKKLPDLGRSLGSGMREFKNSVTGGGDRDELPPAEAPGRAEALSATGSHHASSQAHRPRGGVAHRGPSGRAALAPDGPGGGLLRGVWADDVAERSRSRDRERPAAGRAATDHARARRAVHHHAQELGVCRVAARAAHRALPGVCVPGARHRPARAQARPAAAPDGAGALHRRRRLLLCGRAAARPGFPPQLQRVGVQHPGARKRLLRLRHPHHARHGPRVPGPGGRACPDPPRRGARSTSSAAAAATRSWRSPCSPRCCPRSTRSRSCSRWCP